jgi:hypothetical protein
MLEVRIKQHLGFGEQNQVEARILVGKIIDELHSLRIQGFPGIDPDVSDAFRRRQEEWERKRQPVK